MFLKTFIRVSWMFQNVSFVIWVSTLVKALRDTASFSNVPSWLFLPKLEDGIELRTPATSWYKSAVDYSFCFWVWLSSTNNVWPLHCCKDLHHLTTLVSQHSFQYKLQNKNAHAHTCAPYPPQSPGTIFGNKVYRLNRILSVHSDTKGACSRDYQAKQISN